MSASPAARRCGPDLSLCALSDDAGRRARDSRGAHPRSPALRDLQDKAQQIHETLLDEELEVIYEHAGVIGTWRRGAQIDGAGPIPAYYYDFKGSVVVSWTGT